MKLSDLCDIKMGQSPESSTYNEDGNGLPFFQGNADFGKIHPSVRVWCSAPVKIAFPNDILISVRAPIGAMNIADCECCIGRGLAAITVNDSICNAKYVWYALQSKVNELNAKGTGSTFKAINKATLADTEIPYVSLERQQKIADILDKVSLAIDKRIQQIALFDLLVKSRFVEMFGDPISNPMNWSMVLLSTLSEICSSKRIFENEYVSEGIPFFRTKEIVELSKEKAISTELFISKERFEKIKNKYGSPQKGDLLISAVGTIGTIWVVDGKYDFYFKDGNIIQVKASNTFNSLYMKYLLETLIAEHKKQMSTGTAYSALTISGLQKMMVYNIPLPLQNQFADFVQQTDKSKYAVKKSLEKLETLKKALMQEYFG